MGNYYRRHTSVHDVALGVFVRGRGRVHQGGICRMLYMNDMAVTTGEKEFTSD